MCVCFVIGVHVLVYMLVNTAMFCTSYLHLISETKQQYTQRDRLYHYPVDTNDNYNFELCKFPKHFGHLDNECTRHHTSRRGSKYINKLQKYINKITLEKNRKG